VERIEHLPDVDAIDASRLAEGDHPEPHRILGAHPGSSGARSGIWLRAFHPDASEVACLLEDGDPVALAKVGAGLFAAFLPGLTLPARYRLRFRFPDGTEWERDDPYRFLPTVGDVDLHLFNEGTHRRLWNCLGANPRRVDGVDGVSFAVWAPTARRVSVVGDFCRWDGRLYPMRSLGASGVFEIFLPGVSPGALYKFEIKTREGALRVKADPYARAMEVPPGTASRVWTSTYEWGDREWMEARPARDPAREPMSIYEVHLGSWARVPEDGGRPMTYRELAPRLVAHVKRFGFTHLQLLPVAEHPFLGSWGYQVSAYYAPTSRYGTPDDFKAFVDVCHGGGIGVIVDWVPAHFPKDDFALRRFDGTALYEHDDSRRGEHPDWGTLIFNYGRNEVRNFLIANALYWLEEFHVDALRVDAVASMLYLDYSRKEGEWLPNRFGGRENLEAIDLLRAANETIRVELPGCYTIAEESTSWPLVSRPVSEGGLGFAFKWNMGWMHDTLDYFKKDPIHRGHHQGQLTFAMLYEYSERFIMPLSHDEVVHMKGSLLEKMPGDLWQKLANLRLLLAYQFTRPGKKLLFMGTELAPWREWNHDASLDWHLASEPRHAEFGRFLEDLGALYRDRSPLWRADHEPHGFYWIDCADTEASILSWVRRDGDRQLVVVLNLTPVPRENYRVGAPVAGVYRKVMDSDAREYGGSGFEPATSVKTEDAPYHGHAQSLVLRLPPLGALVLEPPERAASGDSPRKTGAARPRRKKAQPV
jgi:1,4-alpha-glucan branching enzyme